MRVLIDALYRDLRQGSGISTYSRTLASNLSALGHEVIWLSGKPAPRRRDALTDEVMQADVPQAGGGLRQNLNTLRLMGRGLAHPAVAPYIVPDSGAVSSAAAKDAPREAVWASSELYDRAHYRHMLTGAFTQVLPPAHVDVLHLTAPLPLTIKGAKLVTTIHDLIPIRLPETTTDNKAEFIRRVRTAIKKSDLIVTVSEASKRDIVELVGADPDKVAVTYQPVDVKPLSQQEREKLPRTLNRYGLKAGEYALFVGAIEPKKNLRRLIEAFLETPGDMPLVIIGRRAWRWQDEIGDLERVLGAAPLKRLRFLGYAAGEDLRQLYSGAQFLAFPSLYEGFGLPPLEAMTLGCPVLTSNVSSLPEVCGEAAHYVDPTSRESIRDGLEKMMSSEELRTRLKTRGLKQAEQFSEARYRAALSAAYARLA